MRIFTQLLICFVFSSYTNLGIYAAEPEVLELHVERITCMCMSRDDKWMASASDGKVAIIEFATRKEVAKVVYKKADDSTANVTAMSFSSNSETLLIGYTSFADFKGRSMPRGSIDLYDISDKKVKSTFHSDILSNPFGVISVSPNGEFFAVGAQLSPSKVGVRKKSDEIAESIPEGELLLWKQNKISSNSRFITKLGPVSTVSFSPDSKLFAYGCGDNSLTLENAERKVPFGEIVIWNILTDKMHDIIEWKNAAICSSAFSSKGLLAIGGGLPNINFLDTRRSASGHLTIWDPKDKKTVFEFTDGNYLVRALAFSSDGSLLVAGGGDTGLDKGELRLWDVNRKRQIADISADLNSVVTSVSFTRNEKYLIASVGAKVLIWKVSDLIK